MLKDEMAPMSTGALFWQENAWAACLQVLVERPRRRKLQRLPSAALDEHSLKAGHSMASITERHGLMSFARPGQVANLREHGLKEVGKCSSATP